MKKVVFMATLALILASHALGANEKIDPNTYICAEIIAAYTSGEPPLFEGLQIDGYAAQKKGQLVADPDIMAPMLVEISDVCQAAPTDTVLSHWQKLRENHPVANDGPWRADKTTCGNYYANEEDGSGYLIWIDGWQRAKNGNDKSIFASQEILDKFLKACKASPDKLVVNVIGETVGK